MCVYIDPGTLVFKIKTVDLERKKLLGCSVKCSFFFFNFRVFFVLFLTVESCCVVLLSLAWLCFKLISKLFLSFILGVTFGF